MQKRKKKRYLNTCLTLILVTFSRTFCPCSAEQYNQVSFYLVANGAICAKEFKNKGKN